MSDRTSYSGIVKLFKAGTGKGYGYGFIQDQEGRDIFFHISKVKEGTDPELLVPGTEVRFFITEGDKGKIAVDVEVMTGNEALE